VTDQAGRVPLVSVVLAFSVGFRSGPANRSGLADLTLDAMARRFEARARRRAGGAARRARDDCGVTDAAPISRTSRRPFRRTPSSGSFGCSATRWASRPRRSINRSSTRASRWPKQTAPQVDDANAGLASQLEHQTGVPGGTSVPPRVGNGADLTGITVTEVAEFQRRYFVPRNAMLAITGSVDRDEVVRLVTKYFGSLAAGREHATSPRFANEARR